MSSLQLVVVGASLSLVVACSGDPESEATSEHRYTVDVSQYSAPNEPASLFIPNKNLALALEAKNLTLSEAEPGSLQSIYSRSYCDVGQDPLDLSGWDAVQLLDVPPVHLTAVSITLAFDGNDIARKPSFALRDSAGHWSGCEPSTQFAVNSKTLTATLRVDAADATHVAFFPDTYTYVQSITYTTRD